MPGETSSEELRMEVEMSAQVASSAASGTSYRTEHEVKRAQSSVKRRSGLLAVFKLFRFADLLDAFLILLGTLAAIVNGVALPVSMLFFGDLTNAFINHFTSKTLANFEFTFNPRDFIGDTRFVIIEPDIILSGFINFTNLTGGVVNCSEDFVLLPPTLNFNDALQLGVTELASCLDDAGFIPLVNRNVIAFGVIAAIVIIAGSIQVATFQISSDRQVHRIQRKFYAAVLKQDAEWYDRNSSGELSSRLSDDVEKIRGGIGDKLSILIQLVSTFVAGFVIGFVRQWRLALLLLGVTPFIALAIAASSIIVTVLTSKEQEQFASASSVVEEVLSSIKTVVAFGGEKIEADRYDEHLGRARRTGSRKGVTTALSVGFIFFFIFVIYAIAFWFSAYLVSIQVIQAGDMLTVFFAFLIGAFALGLALPNLEKLFSAAGASTTLYDIIDRIPSIDASSAVGATPTAEGFQGSIAFQNVSFAYPTRPDVKVLQGFSLRVEAGKTVALVGPSGCGKSTAIQLLLRSYNIQSGEIILDDADTRSLNLQWLRSMVGIVTQEPVLFDTDIATNIKFGRESAAHKEMEAAARDANAHGFISTMPEGYSTHVGTQGTQLSGGQKQRIAITRALIRDPKILLLDDATSALDSESESIVQSALDRARQGRTTIIVSHRLSTIKTADVIAYMEGGRVVELGSHDQLMERMGAYYNLVTTQYSSLSYEKDAEQFPLEDTDSPNSPEIVTSDKPTYHHQQQQQQQLEKTQSFRGPETPSKESPKSQVSFLRLLKTNRGRVWMFVLGSFAAAIVGAVFPSSAILFGQVLFAFTFPFDQVLGLIHLPAGIFIVLGVVIGLASFVEKFCLSVFGLSLTFRLRSRGFRAALRQEIGWFDDKANSSGALTTRLDSDATQVQGVVGMQFGALVEAISCFLVTILISFIVNWVLALVILVFVPLTLVSNLLQLLVLSLQSAHYKKASERALQLAVDSINNHSTVAALSVEGSFLALYQQSLRKAYKHSFISASAYGLTYGFSQGLLLLLLAVTFRFGAFQQIQPLDHIAFFSLQEIYIVFMVWIFGYLVLGQANSFAPDYSRAMLSARRIFALLDRRPLIDSYSEDGKKPERSTGAVAARGLHLSYPTRPSVQVLKDLSFTVNSGQSLALVGQSGCGKSTVISHLLRFYDTSSGETTLDNTDIKHWNISSLRSQIGVVFQEPVLFDRSIAANIRYGASFREVGDEEVVDAARAANIHDFITSLPQGYDTMVGEKGALLSRGQKQCIAIARALIRNPPLLLLDEATSALDTDSERIVQDALDRALQGRTSITIAHRLSTISGADCIVVVHSGQVVERGSHSELVARKGVYERMYSYQAGGT